MLVTMIVAIAGSAILPTDISHLQYTLSHPPSIRFEPQAVFINRTGVIEQILGVLDGKYFVLVEGEHRVGKSMLVKHLAHLLSASRAVLTVDCPKPRSEEAVIEDLLQLGPQGFAESILSHLKLPLLRTLPGTMDSPKLISLLRSLPPSRSPRPVFVIDGAGKLDKNVLKIMMDMAKTLADDDIAHFVFVFSPSSIVREAAAFGAMSRARVVSVGDLSEKDTVDFLTKSSACNCSEERALRVFRLAGGRFLYLLSDGVKQFCQKYIGEAAFETAMLDSVATDVGSVQGALMKPSGFGCQQLLAIRRLPQGVAVDEKVKLALFKEHLIRYPISKKLYYLSSTLVKTFVDRRCGPELKQDPFASLPDTTAMKDVMLDVAKERGLSEEEVQEVVAALHAKWVRTVGDLRVLAEADIKELALSPVVTRYLLRVKAGGQ